MTILRSSIGSSVAIFTACALVALSAASPTERSNRGRLGVTLYKTAIHARPRENSAVYCRIPKDMRLVVRSAGNGSWIEVLLSTGAFGFVPSDAVQVYPNEYEIRTTPPATSRGGSRGTLGSSDIARDYTVATESQKFLGTPYKWGGNDILNGIDCSGFVKKLYGDVGVALPRTAAEQEMVGTAITRLENLLPGDRLYFWDAKKGKVGHTGIYVGGGYFVHANSSHHAVSRDYLGEPRWRRILYAARR